MPRTKPPTAAAAATTITTTIATITKQCNNKLVLINKHEMASV